KISELFYDFAFFPVSRGRSRENNLLCYLRNHVRNKQKNAQEDPVRRGLPVCAFSYLALSRDATCSMAEVLRFSRKACLLLCEGNPQGRLAAPYRRFWKREVPRGNQKPVKALFRIPRKECG